MFSNPETVQISTAVNKSAEFQGPFPMVVDGGTTEERFLPAQSSQAEYFPGWRKLSVIMLSLYLCMFLVALFSTVNFLSFIADTEIQQDRTILGTAIPTITNDFHSIRDVGWYASAYLLTSCATQLIFGKIYQFYVCKWVLLTAIGIFEVGESDTVDSPTGASANSAICGSAPNSISFILGRAIGSAGIFNGVLLIMMANVPLRKRPVFMGLFGGAFAVANACGPLLGGVFTTKVYWRWCFYINLPIGALVVSVLLITIDASGRVNTDSFRQQLKKFDRLGTLVFVPGIVCLCLALQWGGNTYSWANARIITLLTLGSILLIIFMIIQFHAGENATVPIRIIKQRSIAAGVWFSFFNPGAMFILIYYLPIWFQAIKGLDAINSGLGMQQSNLAAQTCLSRENVSTGMALMFFSQGLGGVVFITIAQVVFSHSLVVRLSYLDIPLLTPDVILHAGVTELRRLVSEEYIPDVLEAYNLAIMATFMVATAAACFTSFAAAGMEFINIHKAASEGGVREIEHGSGSGEVEEEVTGGASTLMALGEGRKSRDKGPGAMEQPTLETITEEREKGSGDSSPVSTVLVMGGNEKESGAVEVREAKGKEVERREELEIKEKSDG
ncbi:hypothetical protein CJF32_00003198 [Rutstroemia sp. NJR-2017a WRK4]|nr:hypothetical protein CJF32_00003198 [Rutstroemia sp. NJR-2017a WRK4]